MQQDGSLPNSNNLLAPSVDLTGLVQVGRVTETVTLPVMMSSSYMQCKCIIVHVH